MRILHKKGWIDHENRTTSQVQKRCRFRDKHV